MLLSTTLSRLCVFGCVDLGPYLVISLFRCVEEVTGHSKLPYKAVGQGEISLELRGVPGVTRIKDPSEMGEATLSKIIEHTEHIQLALLDNVDGVENYGRRVGEDAAEGISRVENDDEGTDEVGQDEVETSVVDSDVVRTDEGDQALAGTSLVDSDTLSTNEGVHDAVGVSEGDDSTSVAQTSQIENNVMGAEEVGNEARGLSEEMSQQDCAGGRRKRRKEKDTEKSKKKKKKSDAYQHCSAFLCHEPSVDETGCVNWIQCDKCDDWFHLDCVGLLRSLAGNFFCGCDRILFSSR